MICHPLDNLRPTILERGADLDFNQPSVDLGDDMNRPVPERRPKSAIDDLRLRELLQQTLDEVVLLRERHFPHDAHPGDVLDLTQIHRSFPAELRHQGLNRLESRRRPDVWKSRHDALPRYGKSVVELAAKLLQQGEVLVADGARDAESVAESIDGARAETVRLHQRDATTPGHRAFNRRGHP
jgi:hypothetical protein